MDTLNYTPTAYTKTKEQKENIKYGKYFVVKKDPETGKETTCIEVFNGTGWAYDDDKVITYYLPKLYKQ
jgi:hypothetical protein